jgi:20S proteasome alpha/beta subunit
MSSRVFTMIEGFGSASLLGSENGADQYISWNADDSGNDRSNAFDFAPETSPEKSAALESSETGFQQDINGDDVTGPPASAGETAVEAVGTTSLLGSGSIYLLQPNGGPTVAPSYDGAPGATGQFDQLGGHGAPIGTEQAATGDEAGWKAVDAGPTVWITNNSGNHTSIALETNFQPNINSADVVGPLAAPAAPASPGSTVIEAFGTTSLLGSGNNYFLQPNSGPSVELSYGGSPVVDGQFDQFGGHWVPIGAEQTANGYEVAWKIAGADAYTVWYTDSSGNYLSSSFDSASGSSAAMESFETSFHQDLNGDGIIGPPSSPTPTVIEASGTTSLIESSSNYFLQPNNGPSVELSYGGAPVVDGQFADPSGNLWVPIGAEQTANGYEVAWKAAGADEYTVWYTDSNGKYLSSSFDSASGSSAAMESFETSFHQDLNGDGVIGPPSSSPPTSPTVIEAFGTTSLIENGNNYFLEPNGGPSVELSYGGAPVVDGQFADPSGNLWVPIGAEQTASGYEVAWKATGVDEYTVWYTDSNGKYLSSSFDSASGSSAAMESFETSFHQDLNGDGVIGPPSSPTPTVIEAFGTTSLIESSSNYFLQPNSGPSVELSYGGAPVVDGQFADPSGNLWVPIGAEQTANGYEVAWKATGVDEYTVWYTDSNGKYLSSSFDSASGSSAAMESFETSFHQDLNGDGIIGPPSSSPPTSPTVIEAFGTTSLVESGNNYFLEPNGGPSVELSYGGAPVVDGQFADPSGNLWVPIGAEQTANGYEVAWKATGVDEYTVWYTDSSGKYLSSSFDSASGSSAAMESFETSFHQDLNGDGVIGPPSSPTPTVIEAFGTTSLIENGNNYFLQPDSGPSVELSYGGSPVVDGQFDQFGGHWVPIGAEQTANGYEVAWKIAGADAYTVWYTDSSGNYLSSSFDSASGSSAAMESFETSFHQDLNGDGVIGPPSVPVIETAGSTSLLQDGSNYFLAPTGGAEVELSYGGSPVVAGQFTDQFGSSWTPIGAEQTANGFEVAWKVPGADEYMVWNTDAHGNYVSTPLNSTSGTSSALQSIETSFHQDLNGDGVIGLSQPQFVYEGLDADGAQLYSVTWANSGLQPIAVRVLQPENPSTDYTHSFLFALPVEGGLAQSTYGSGLDELQKLDVQDQYNATIIEPIFPMDSWYANSGTNATINYETFTATILTAWADSTFATTGDEKNLLLGFSKSGYGALDLLFKHPGVFDAAAVFDFPANMNAYDNYGTSSANDYGTDLNFQDNYRIDQDFLDTWKAPFTAEDRILISEGPAFTTQVTDFDSLLTSNGIKHTLLTNQVSDAHTWYSGWLTADVAGLYGLETDLHQTVVETSGSTSLMQDGNDYYLRPASGAQVELSDAGSPVVAGQFSDQSGNLWSPLGAEQTSSGYEVAWKENGADQYMVWNTDKSGNYLSTALNATPGTSAALESFEFNFQQDLNHDGYIGLVLDGSSGSQTLTAGSSPTTVIGGPNDVLNAGSAPDNFVFKTGADVSVVNNFVPGTDTLQFSQSLFADAGAALSNAHQIGSDVAIMYDARAIVTLHNLQLANLHTADFHIV